MPLGGRRFERGAKAKTQGKRNPEKSVFRFGGKYHNEKKHTKTLQQGYPFNPKNDVNVWSFNGRQYVEKFLSPRAKKETGNGIEDARRMAACEQLFRENNLPVRVPRVFYADEDRIIMEYIDAQPFSEFVAEHYPDRYTKRGGGDELFKQVNKTLFWARRLARIKDDSTFVRVKPDGSFEIVVADVYER